MVVVGIEDIFELMGIATATEVIYEKAMPKVVQRVKDALAANPEC